MIIATPLKRKGSKRKSALAKLRWYQNTYRRKEVVVNGKKISLATLDPGKIWYQVFKNRDGVHVFLSPDKEATAAFDTNRKIQEIIKRRDDL